MILESQQMIGNSKKLAWLHIITQETRWWHQNSNIFQIYEGLIRHSDVCDVRYHKWRNKSFKWMLRSPRWGQIELKSLLWWHIFARGERRRCQQSDILTFYDIKYGVTDQFVVSDVIFDVTMASAPIKNSKFWIQSIRILTTLRVTQVEICKCTICSIRSFWLTF